MMMICRDKVAKAAQKDYLIFSIDNKALIMMIKILIN